MMGASYKQSLSHKMWRDFVFVIHTYQKLLPVAVMQVKEIPCGVFFISHQWQTDAVSGKSPESITTGSASPYFGDGD